MRSGLADGDRLWFLMGTDAFREIHTWNRYPEIFRLADVAVMRRPPDDGPVSLPACIRADFSAFEGGFRHASGREVRFVPVTLLDISSTRIREALAVGRSVRYLVPDAVLPCLTPISSEPQDSKGAHG
jgi:nicotinate-nucleotide adenylyltransferase